MPCSPHPCACTGNWGMCSHAVHPDPNLYVLHEVLSRGKRLPLILNFFHESRKDYDWMCDLKDAHAARVTAVYFHRAQDFFVTRFLHQHALPALREVLCVSKIAATSLQACTGLSWPLQRCTCRALIWEKAPSKSTARLSSHLCAGSLSDF